MGQVTDAVAEESTVELTADEKAIAEELAGFEAAVEGVDLPKTEDAEEENTHAEEAKADAAQDAEKIEAVAEAAKTVEPELAKVTQDQLKELLATAGSIKELSEGLKKLEDKTFGKIGGLERLVKQAEKLTESGLDLTLTDEDFAEVDTEVPMLTKPLQKLINKIVKQAKVKVPAAEAIDVEALRTKFIEEVDTKVKEARLESYKELQTTLLTDRFPDWKETVAKKDFHEWLASEDKLTPGYQNMFLQSWNATEIGGVLKKFNAHKDAAEKAKTQAPPVKTTAKVTQKPSNSRVERLKEAELPRASSVTPKPKGPMTEEEAFEAVG